MAYYNKPHPWDPGFAVPDYARSENPGRAGGIHTTIQLPRGTFDDPGAPARPWVSGFALPAYVQNEPLGRGTVGTGQLRRRRIPVELQPSLGSVELPQWALPVAGAALLLWIMVK